MLLICLQVAFPVVIQVTMSTDDNSILQSGGECLRAYISVSPDQISGFVDPAGKSGLEHIVNVAGHLLNPSGRWLFLFFLRGW